MLNKKFSWVVIGRNYLSLIFAHLLLNKKIDVLLVLDEECSSKLFSTDHLTSMEKDFLTLWSEDQQIKNLENLNFYLKSERILLRGGEHRVLLGHPSPFQNLWELARSFPFFFTDSKDRLNFGMNFNSSLEEQRFNKSYFRLTKKFSKSAFYYHDRHDLDFKILENLCPKIIRDLFDNFQILFFDKNNSEKQWPLQEILFASRLFIQNHLSVETTKTDLLYLFISILSPLYKLNHKKLKEDLLSSFEERGGNFMTTTIQNWKWKNGKIYGFQHDKDDVTITSNQICLFYPLHKQGPFEFSSIEKSIGENFCLSYLLKEKIRPQILSNIQIDTSMKSMRTQTPLWITEVLEKQINFYIFFKASPLLSLSSMKSQAIRIIQKEFFKYNLGWNASQELHSSSLGQDLALYSSKNKTSELLKESGPLKNLTISFKENSHRSFKLNDINYFGPLKEQSYGLFGIFVEMKDLLN